MRESAALRQRRHQIVLVSSGAVAAGMARLGLRERPRTVPQKQAAAAVGQIGLMASTTSTSARSVNRWRRSSSPTTISPTAAAT